MIRLHRDVWSTFPTPLMALPVDDIDQVCEAAFKWKLEYNEQRPHQALNGLTPERVLQNHRKQQSPLISGTNSGR